MEKLSEKTKKSRVKEKSNSSLQKRGTAGGSGARAASCRYFLAGFFLSGLVAGVGFALMGVWPFGDKTLLIIDSLHQYLPFYTEFHEKLVNGETHLLYF